jgi:hypothetical protein
VNKIGSILITAIVFLAVIPHLGQPAMASSDEECRQAAVYWEEVYHSLVVQIEERGCSVNGHNVLVC